MHMILNVLFNDKMHEWSFYFPCGGGVEGGFAFYAC